MIPNWFEVILTWLTGVCFALVGLWFIMSAAKLGAKYIIQNEKGYERVIDWVLKGAGITFAIVAVCIVIGSVILLIVRIFIFIPIEVRLTIIF